MANSITRAISCGLFIGVAGAAASAHDILYAMTSPLSPTLVTLDPDTGNELNAIAITGQEALFGGLGADIEHAVLYSIDGFNDPDSDRLFKIDPVFGTGGVVGPTGENWNFRCVDVHPETGVIYAIRDNALYVLDGSTGAAKLIKALSAPTLDQLTSLAINHQGEAYGTDIGNTGLFKIDLESGDMKHVGDIGQTSNWYNDMAFSSEGVLLACRLNGGVFKVDVNSASEGFAFEGNYIGIAFMGEAHSCYADCDESGTLNIDDFICFQTNFVLGDPSADCDASGSLNIDDFICFQTLFVLGC